MPCLFPYLPRGLIFGPQIVQVFVFTIGVHRVEKSIVLVSHQLLVGGQAFERLALQNALVAAQVVEDLFFKDEKSRASAAFAARLLHKLQHAATIAGIDNAKARSGHHSRNRGDLAVAPMEGQQRLQIHVADAIAIGQQECAIIDIFLNTLDPAAGHGRLACIHQGDAKVLLRMIVVVFNMGAAPEADGKVAVHRLVVQEVVLNHIAAIAKAKNELLETGMGVDLHDVPENRTPSYLNHRLWPELGLFPQAGAKPAAEDNNLHPSPPESERCPATLAVILVRNNIEGGNTLVLDEALLL